MTEEITWPKGNHNLKTRDCYDLKWLREHSHITQEVAAELLGVTRGAYAKWECGERRPPQHLVARFASIVVLPATEIPTDLKMNAEADAFAAEVHKAMGTPAKLVAVRLSDVPPDETAEGLPALPPIDIALHRFLPSTMKKFNVPRERWAEYVKDRKGESSADLEKAGYSWDQAVEWRTPEARTQAYALLRIWEEARNAHYKERAIKSRLEKKAMTLLVFARIVELFDLLLDERGWGLV